jgi:transglutaminase-like putative cysteine protease
VAITQAAPALRYSVTLEPHQQTWLFALEQMTAYDDALRVTRELQLFARERVNNALNYRMTAVLDAVNQGMYAPERSKNLRLPTAFNPQTQQLGKRMRMRAGSDTEIIKQALEYFASNAFVYTLSPDVLGEHAMDDFLFNTRRGFCEHYASAFVYLMRAAGLPARVVIGYQGGEMNPQDAYMIVRQSDAHAWAEVWVDDARWLRVDPTAAVSPLRIERGIQSAGLEPQLLPRLLLANNALLQRLRYRWDSFQHQWNQWVIGFDETRQRELFKLLGINDVKKSDLVLWLVVAMSFAGALVAWWVIRSNPFGERDRVRKAYAIFKRKLARRGIKVSAQDTPRELLEKICHQLPATQSAANAILSQYQQLVYGSSRNRESEHIFMRAVRRFRVA